MGVPSTHSFENWIFHEINHPAGYQHDYGNPHIFRAKSTKTLQLQSGSRQGEEKRPPASRPQVQACFLSQLQWQHPLQN